MRRTGWALLAVFAVGLAACTLLAQPKQAPKEVADVGELQRQLDELTRGVNRLSSELARQASGENSPLWHLSGDWQLTEATQGGKPVTAPVSRLSFDGNRVRFKYRDLRSERVSSYRVDAGSPLPSLDLFEPGGTVTLGAFAIGGGEAAEITDEVTEYVLIAKKVVEKGKEVEVQEYVPKSVLVKRAITYGTELRLALDRGSGVRPADLSGKDPAFVVWVFKRDGPYRRPPRPDGPTLPVPPIVPVV